MRSKCCQFKLIELSEMIYMPSAFCLPPCWLSDGAATETEISKWGFSVFAFWQTQRNCQHMVQAPNEYLSDV